MDRRTFLGFLAIVPLIGKVLPVQPAVAVPLPSPAPVSIPVPPCAGMTVRGRPMLVERIYQYSAHLPQPRLDVTEKWISHDGDLTFEYILKNGTIRECRSWRA